MLIDAVVTHGYYLKHCEIASNTTCCHNLAAAALNGRCLYTGLAIFWWRHRRSVRFENPLPAHSCTPPRSSERPWTEKPPVALRHPTRQKPHAPAAEGHGGSRSHISRSTRVNLQLLLSFVVTAHLPTKYTRLLFSNYYNLLYKCIFTKIF